MLFRCRHCKELGRGLVLKQPVNLIFLNSRLVGLTARLFPTSNPCFRAALWNQLDGLNIGR